MKKNSQKILVALAVAFTMNSIQAKSSSVTKLQDELYFLDYEGDYGFEQFLENGGAASDREMAGFVGRFLMPSGTMKSDGIKIHAGCSTLSAKTAEGKFIFARNYDWEKCGSIIVYTHGTKAYSSISTCCYDFLGFGEKFVPEGPIGKAMAAAAIYAPLDGINEKGLCIAILVAGDDVETHQDSGKIKLTTVSALRYVLDYAATVDEAISLLKNIDMNSSNQGAQHYAISDAKGNSVAVEYIAGKMVVTKTPYLTNHYLAKKKNGVGIKENPTSKLRFDSLQNAYKANKGIFSVEEITQAISNVTKSKFPAKHYTTEWTIVYNKNDLCLDFYRREEFAMKYKFDLKANGAFIGFEEKK